MSNTTNESVVYLTALLDRQRSKAREMAGLAGLVAGGTVPGRESCL